MQEPSPDNAYLREHVRLMMDSYRRLTGETLVPATADAPQALYEAPFAVVSHNTAADPIFNYGNRTALGLFEMDWHRFTQLPSRCSAAPVNRAERERLLAQVSQHGFIQDYRGERISASGRRFQIEQATVWNLTDAAGDYRGQAAVFAHWIELEPARK